MITEEEGRRVLDTWERPDGLYAPEGEDDADALDGVQPLPTLSVGELIEHRWVRR